MPEAEVKPAIRSSTPPDGSEARPWQQPRTERPRTEQPFSVKQWWRSMEPPQRRKAVLVITSAALLEAAGVAGALHAGSALLPNLDTGLVPHPSPGMAPTPPAAH